MKALIRKYFGNTGFHYFLLSSHTSGFPGGSEGKASDSNAGDLGSIPGSGRSPGEGNGNPLKYSCLENLMDRGAWWATVHGVAKSWTRLSDFTFTFTFSYFCPLMRWSKPLTRHGSPPQCHFKGDGETFSGCFPSPTTHQQSPLWGILSVSWGTTLSTVS